MRILVAVDLAMHNHDWLLQCAASFARRLGTILDIVYVRRERASATEIDGYQRRLDGMIARIDTEQRGRARLEIGNAPETVLVRMSTEYDAVVVGPREPGAVERMLKGTMAVRIMLRAHCGVLVPRKHDWAEPGRLLVGVDLKGPVQQMLVERAAHWADSLGAKLDLVYAVAERIPTIRDPVVAARAEKEWLARHHEEQLALLRLLERHVHSKVRGDVQLRRGAPEEVLVSLSEQYDLVVVGNRERQGLAGLLLGAVAQPVVRRARCDVLTLNTADLE